MPELPEVETVANDLKKKILNKKIGSVSVRLKKIIKSPYKKFVTEIISNKFADILRRGKFLIFELDKGGKYLIIHLRMTGQLIYQQGKDIVAGGHSDSSAVGKLPNKHSHLIFYFTDGSALFFNDQRQFGVVQIMNKKGLAFLDAQFGVEPLSPNFSLRVFRDLLKNRRGNLKAFLLNQKFIVGIGNIYADEILFASGVLPERSVDSLSDGEIKKLHRNTKVILKKAIKQRGTTFNNFVDGSGRRGKFLDFLQVYGRKGEKCLRCSGGKIKKIKIAGRGTSFCPRCQK